MTKRSAVGSAIDASCPPRFVVHETIGGWCGSHVRAKKYAEPSDTHYPARESARKIDEPHRVIAGVVAEHNEELQRAQTRNEVLYHGSIRRFKLEFCESSSCALEQQYERDNNVLLIRIFWGRGGSGVQCG